MRRFSIVRSALLIACCGVGVSSAQMNPADMGGLADIKMVEPGPELPGDRGMSCDQLAREMGAIMKKRNLKKAVASSKQKVCRGKRELDRQGEEWRQLQAAQQPALATAGAVGGPVATVIVNKTNAENLALNAKQQPARQAAVTDLHSGMGDMMGVMNDPRLMRLGMLAMDKQCGEQMAPPKEEQAPAGDGCDDVEGPQKVSSKKIVPDIAMPSGPADPFVKKGVTAPKPAASDPFAKR